MAKHAAPQTAGSIGVTAGTGIIRPVALSAEAYLGRLRAAATTIVPAAAGRHSRA
ncbi:hypothetical protein ACR9E3_16990 [Actinomycetospora sp. C-140]